MNNAATATIGRLANPSLAQLATPNVGTSELPVGAAVFTGPKECWVLPSNHPLMTPRLGTREIPSEDDEDEEEEGEEEISDGESCGTVSDYSTDEIPVWIKGEQRFISGVTEETTCADLIEALIQQENLAVEAAGTSVEPKEYCITERWRQVEQILDGKTKIWQIWSAWGKAQPEVKFILRRLDGSHGLALASTSGSAPSGLKATAAAAGTERDKDSGRGSPTGSINSAIVRRKRHRAHKSSFAWMTHGTTIHPKSSKNSIERLMKLILEQGDIIQQQLTKLRDRELQISKIEDDRHRLREREHGKNYLLETYLKGLSEATQEDDPTAGGDSGITSEATTAASPEVESCRDAESPGTSSTEKDGGLKEQIRMLEKIVQINKQIVKEEESAVKLYDRIRRYQLDIPNQSPEQVKENLTKVNASLEKSQSELMEVDESLKHSEVTLREKNLLLKRLEEELEEEEHQANVIMDFSQPNPVLSISRMGPPAEAADPLLDPLPAHHPSYPLYTINEQQQHNTLPRNQRFPIPSQSAPAPITVHQINKFIQSNSKLGNNCSAMLDDKICPKKLFNSALFEGRDGPPHLDHDLACMGTLV
ncbi:ras association domain-containing protein 10 [Culex pipiens pallens]|uniref:ras association domain-containing protein 10 n=1 Tax=Culex pipiens pallens TaxID=42434 RepID=UPI0019545CDF|nr:ras association domain-containing protein 10 [Culex pipiens pallens]XP_052564229.1 ras association domain-containing protein 10 [Culex pipiens pallens]